MTPYHSPIPNPLKSIGCSILIAIALVVAQGQSQVPPDNSNFDALTRAGFEHFYSLEYDQAIQDFQSAREARPDEPKAINHLLEARLFQQLYRYNALDTRLYTKQRFLSSK